MRCAEEYLVFVKYCVMFLFRVLKGYFLDWASPDGEALSVLCCWIVNMTIPLTQITVINVTSFMLKF